MTSTAPVLSDIDVLRNLVKRFKGCLEQSGTDKEFAEAAVVHEKVALERLADVVSKSGTAHDDRAQMPTVDEIKKVLDDFSSAVDRQDVLEGTVRAAVCTAMLERVLVAMMGLPPGSMRAQNGVDPSVGPPS